MVRLFRLIQKRGNAGECSSEQFYFYADKTNIDMEKQAVIFLIYLFSESGMHKY